MTTYLVVVVVVVVVKVDAVVADAIIIDIQLMVELVVYWLVLDKQLDDDSSRKVKDDIVDKKLKLGNEVEGPDIEMSYQADMNIVVVEMEAVDNIMLVNYEDMNMLEEFGKKRQQLGWNYTVVAVVMITK